MNAIGRTQRETVERPLSAPRTLLFQPPAEAATRPSEAARTDRSETTIERGEQRAPIAGALEREAPPPPVRVQPLAERDRLLFSLSNDNFLSMLGLPPKSGFGAGDDFGATHGFSIELRLCREHANLFFGLSSDLYTQELGPRRTRNDGKELATQSVVEITKLYFAVEMSPKSEGYTRLFGGVGLRNGQREIPGLAMWLQQGLHSMLPRAPAFDNRPTEAMTPFLELGGAVGARTNLGDKLRIRGEVGASLNTFFAGSRAFALVEAELPIAGPLKLRGGQLAEILAHQKFSFVSTGGIFMEFPTWMIGVQAKLPLGGLDDRYTRYNDRDPTLELRVEVGL